MAKSIFLQRFQENLVAYICEVLKEWGMDHLIVQSEKCDLDGFFNGQIDICIFDPNNKTSVVAIEIEHKSNNNQAYRNIEKLKEWAYESKTNKCGLVHIFNEDTNVALNKIDEMIAYARQIQLENKGFYYEYSFYDVIDGREKLKRAEKLAYSMDFCTRLMILMKEVKLI